MSAAASRESGASSRRGHVGDERRAQIRDAALTLFSERGYHGTGVEDIAAQVGLRASSLYNHMDSKHDLLVDIMLTTMRDLLDSFAEATRDTKGVTAALRAAMGTHVVYHGTHHRDVRIGNREIASLTEPAQTQVKELRREYAHAWQHLIEAGVQQGVFISGSPQLASYALLEMGIGVAQWYRPDGPLSLDEIAQEYGTMALRQLGVAPCH